MKLRVFLCLALLAASVAGYSLDAQRLTPRQLALSVTRPGSSGFTSADALMILRSLHQKLQEADAAVVIVEVPEMPPAATPEQMGAAAGGAGADGWVLLTLDGQWTSPRLAVRADDLLSHATVADVEVTRTGWSSPASLAAETWADVGEAVAGKFPMVKRDAPPVEEQLVRLTVTALPGSEVTGLGNPPLRIDSSGSASRMLRADREYALQTSLAGYLSVSQRVFLSTDREVTVAQKRPSLWGLDVSLSDSRAPGLDFTMTFPNPAIFVRVGLSTYALALALSSTQVLLSQPLTDIDLRAGFYLSPPDRPFRFYVGLGGFARIMHARDLPLMFEPVAPLGFLVLGGTEIPVLTRGRVYLEYTPSLYLSNQPDALRASLGPDDAPGWLFVPFGGFNILSFRIGCRWPL